MIPRPCPSTAATAGFTLIEALLAIALTALAIGGLATLTKQWLRSWDHGIVRIQLDEDIALGLERLASDLSSAEFVPPDRRIAEPWFEGDSHSVTFVRTALGPNTGPGLELVRIEEIAGELGPTLVRSRIPFTPSLAPRNGRAQRKFGDPVVLEKPPFRLSFAYAGSDRVWREIWTGQTLLPKVIQLTLRDSATSRVLVSTATTVHARIPMECLNAKSIAGCLQSRLRANNSSEADRSPL